MKKNDANWCHHQGLKNIWFKRCEKYIGKFENIKKNEK